MGFNASGIEENVTAYGGGLGYGGGFGGSGLIIIVLLILFVLFKDGGHGHYDGGHGYPGYGMPYGFGGNCGVCSKPTFTDESNWEEESHLKDKLCCIDKEILKTDADVWKSACETQQVEHCEAEKTRALIEQNYIQDLRDKLAEKNDVVMTLKQEMFTEKKFDQLATLVGGLRNDIDKQFCRTDAEIAALSCELPKRQPVYAETVTCNTHHVDCDDRHNYGGGYGGGYGQPRRGNCDGCNDGLYGYGYAY